MYITVIALKGGQAKTTTSTNLASAFAVQGLPGVLVDLDRQTAQTEQRKGTIEGVEFLNELPEQAPEGGFVIVDTPSIFVPEMGDALLKSDLALIPVTPHSKSLDSLANTFASISTAREKKGDLQACLVFTRVSSKQYAQGIIAATKVLCEWPVLESCIPDKEMDFEKADNAGKTLVLHLPRSLGAKAYFGLADELKESFS